MLAGNITYLGINADIDAAITAATAGDTIFLASGTYTVTDDIDCTKAINIVGQGVGKTIIACATASKNVFDISASNVRIADLSIDIDAIYVYGIKISGVAGTVLSGIVIDNVDIDILAGGTTIYGISSVDASGIVRNVHINMETGGNGAWAFNAANESTAESATTWYIYNCNFTAKGAGASTHGIIVQDTSATQVCTVYAYGCSLYAFTAGTSETYGVRSYGGADAKLYAENCVINGLSGSPAYDAINDTGTLQLRNCTLVNNTTSGTITSDGSVYANQFVANGTNLLAGIVANAAANLATSNKFTVAVQALGEIPSAYTWTVTNNFATCSITGDVALTITGLPAGISALEVYCDGATNITAASASFYSNSERFFMIDGETNVIQFINFGTGKTYATVENFDN